MSARSASDVVKEAEARLRRAAALRDDARRLVEEAEVIESEARAAAVAALGDAHGHAAFGLALLSFPDADAALRRADAGEARTPIVSSPPRLVSPVPFKAVTNPVEESASDREILWGIAVPTARFEEAEALVREATASAAQGKKSNPYATDRGKNAWRRSLFAAVIERLGSVEADDIVTPTVARTVPKEASSASPISVPVVEASAAIPVEPPAPAPVESVCATTPASPANDPLFDELPGEVAAPAVPVIDHILESHPVPPTRRPAFGAAVPMPDGFATSPSPVSRPPMRPGIRRPGYVNKGV